MKITENQKEILKLLQDGWEIGIDTGLYTRAWMQKGGLGRGGEARNVPYNTFDSLCSKGLIAQNNEHPYASPRHYHITDLGIKEGNNG